jgi:Phage integrase family
MPGFGRGGSPRNKGCGFPLTRQRSRRWTPGRGGTSTQARDRVAMRAGALLCVIDGPTQGRPWTPTAARATLRRLAATAGVRRRFAPHQLRPAHAVEMAREGVPVLVQRQLGHANLGITGIYLQGIDSSEIIDTRPPATRTPAPSQRRTPIDRSRQPTSTGAHRPQARAQEFGVCASRSAVVGCALVSFSHFPPSDPVGAERLRAATSRLGAAAWGTTHCRIVALSRAAPRRT